MVTAQTDALNNERTAVDILGRRMAAAVLLVKALGGGWTASELPSPADVSRSSGRSDAEGAMRWHRAEVKVMGTGPAKITPDHS